MPSLFDNRMQAQKMLVAIYEQIAAYQHLCDEAGIAVPAELREFIDGRSRVEAAPAAAGKADKAPRRGQKQRGHAPRKETVPKAPNGAIPPLPEVRPRGVPSDWISIPLADATMQTLVLATLRAAGRAMAPKEIAAAIQAKGHSTSLGSITNIGGRIDAIKRGPSGWTLLVPEKAPVVGEDALWGAPSVLTSPELAARRRLAILHALRSLAADGVMAAELLTALGQCDWLRCPLSKDVLKADLENLSRGSSPRLVRDGKKWRLRVT
jgi:hypothetical protein